DGDPAGGQAEQESRDSSMHQQPVRDPSALRTGINIRRTRRNNHPAAGGRRRGGAVNRPSYRLSAALLAAIALGACGDSTGPDTNRVESVEISPDNPTMFVGEEVQLTARGLNSSGQAV